MRVLLVSHLFPPDHEAGTELYTAALGKELAALGHEVAVFATTKDIGREHGSVADREHEGLAVRELVNNLYHESFEESYGWRAAERVLEQLLEEVRPEVVHFNHLMYLSVGCLQVAKRFGAGVVFTLHDFWLECPRFGQLVHADGGVCETVDFARCGSCLPSLEWRQPPGWQRAGRMIAGIKGKLGVDLGPVARGLGRGMRRVKDRGTSDEEPTRDSASTEEVRAFERHASERAERVRSAVLEHVDRFISPSRFLLERLERWGLPAERSHHFPTGIERGRFARPKGAKAPDPDGLVHVAFLGTLVPIKGAHVLLEAWGKLPEELGSRGELTLFGPSDHAPAYVADLGEQAEAVGAELGGVLDRRGVAEVLAKADVLVVPSIWYENRPLIVLEALAMSTPVIVSEPGGMAELVEDGVTGWRFPMGDSGALAERLGYVLEDPRRLDALRFDDVPLADWSELAERTAGLYEEVLAEGDR